MTLNALSSYVDCNFMRLKQDIDNRRGERLIRDGGHVKFDHKIYTHPALKEWAGFPVIIAGHGWYAINIYLIERKIKQKWGKGKYLCTIED